MDPEADIDSIAKAEKPVRTERSDGTGAWTVAIVLLVVFFIPHVFAIKTNYWVKADSQRGVATVTVTHSHNSVSYRYKVNQKEYTGRDYLPFGNEGDKTFVFFSASHPGLSRLKKPILLDDSPLLSFILSIIEIMAVNTAINPNSKWALRDRTAEQKNGARLEP